MIHVKLQLVTIVIGKLELRLALQPHITGLHSPTPTVAAISTTTRPGCGVAADDV